MLPNTKKKLHWVCNSPSPYNDFLFKKLHKSFDCELSVHYLDTTAEHAALLCGDTGYRWRRIRSRFFDRELYSEAVKEENLFVIGGWNCPLYILLFFLASGRYLLWTDTPNSTAQRGRMKVFLRNLAVRACFRHSKAVMGTGAPALGVLEQMGAAKSRLVNFPYWVEVPPAAASLPSGNVAIVCVGRLEKIKSFDHVVVLAEQLLKHGMRNFEIQLIGDGSQRQELQRLVETRNLKEHVKLVGWLGNAEVQARVASCDIFLHPASWEPYGVVILEAMARGRTVVATDRSMAAVDRINSGENGYIYPYGDIDELCRLVLGLASDEDLLAETGRAAYRTACEWKVDRALDILRQAMSTGKGCAL